MPGVRRDNSRCACPVPAVPPLLLLRSFFRSPPSLPPSLPPSVCRVVGLSVGLLPQCRRLGGQIFSSSIALFPRLIHSLARSLAPHASACCLAAYLSWDSVIVVVRHPVLCQCANHAASSSALFASLQPSSCSSNRLLWSDVSSLHH